jgi:hypothetical protein
MRKMVVMLCVVVLVFTLVPANAPAATSSREPGGAMAFIVGMVFGPREGLEWNEGRNLHWREWAPLICCGFSIWNGVDCAKGMTTKEFAEKNGTNWY